MLKRKPELKRPGPACGARAQLRAFLLPASAPWTCCHSVFFLQQVSNANPALTGFVNQICSEPNKQCAAGQRSQTKALSVIIHLSDEHPEVLNVPDCHANHVIGVQTVLKATSCMMHVQQH